VHALLEHLDPAAPAVPDDLEARVGAAYPAATADDVERVRAFVREYCESPLAARIAALPGARRECHFTFEHDGVLFHGYLDVVDRSGPRALVVDYKTNAIDDEEPEAILDADYRLQRLVYALACLRAGSDEVEVVYQFLERPAAPVTAVFSRDDVPKLERELSAAVAAIAAGEFRPTPSERACAGCPALDVVCAGPALRAFATTPAAVAA
jgi:ATP-dependent helicase/nuclease subunit A